MILSSPSFRQEDPPRSHGLAGAPATHGSKLLTRCLLSMIASFGLAGGLHGPVQGATFGPLEDGDVSGLINAIEVANANGETDIILLATNSTYTLSPTADARIPFFIDRLGNTGLPSITSTITIQGNGSVIERAASLLTDPEVLWGSALNSDRFQIIQVAETGALTLEEVTIQNGCTDLGPDDGITNFGTLTLTHSTVRDNTGGGIVNEGGTLTLTHSTVYDNMRRTGIGGGIVNSRFGTVTLTHSTVRDNTRFGIYNQSGTVTLTHTTVHGNIGSGILNDGTGVTLTHSTVRDNTGGGIENNGTLTLTHSTVSGNGTNVSPIGGIVGGGTVPLTHSTVSGNIGGGIGFFGGTLTLTNSTVSNNRGGPSAGIFNQGTLTLTNSTVSGNTGVGIGNQKPGEVTLTNSIIADQAGGKDCANTETFPGTFTSNDFNLDSDGTCQLDQPHDKPNNPNANLCLFQIYPPGNTATHALLPDSTAIDMGDCSGDAITNDQRGVPRPQGAACDIGAFELVSSLECTPIPDPDLNQDGAVNILDVAQVGSCVGEDPTASTACEGADINDDGTIDLTDVNFVRGNVEQRDF